MEAITQNQGNENKKDVEILGEHLAGKTEAELTQEEREAEEKFCKENFKKFLDWMNNDEIFLHTVSGSDTEGVMQSILEKGILSGLQLEKSGVLSNAYDRPFQGDSNDKSTGIISSFLDIYKKFEDGVIDQGEYEAEKNKIIETAPKIGRARVAYFLDTVIPRIIEEVGYPVKPYNIDWKRNRDSFSKLYPIYVERQVNTGLGIRNTLSQDNINVSPENTPEEYKNIETWDSLPDVMAGMDLVSTSSPDFMKRDFSKQLNFFSSELPIPGVDIYFKAPHELRQFEQGVQDEDEGERGGGDIGVSNRIHQNSFRAIRFGVYDSESRVLDLAETGDPGLSDISQISKLQDHGLVLLDKSLLPIPPLKSIRINVSKRDLLFRFHGYRAVYGLTYPTQNMKTIEEVRSKIKEGKIDMSLEEFEESLKNNHLMNTMLSNQQKSLAMIEEMGGIKYEDETNKSSAR